MTAFARRAFAAALTVVLAGCAADADPDSAGPGVVRTDSAGVEIVDNHRPAWGPGEGWAVGTEPLFILGASDGSEQNRLLDPTSVDVDSRGRIIVGDGNQVGWDAAMVYDSVGNFLFQAGREGEGPGEFGQLWWASAYRGDSIVAFDMSGDRLSIFSPEGDFARMVRVPRLETPPPPQGTSGYTAGADAAFGDGAFLAYPFGTLDISEGPGPAWYRHSLLRLSPDGSSWDTLGVFGISQRYWDGSSQEQYWFGPSAWKATTSDGLFYGPNETFEVEYYDASGRLTRILRREWEPRPVTDELRQALLEWYLDRLSGSPEVNEQILERIRRDFETARFAEHVPPYSGMLVDDQGNLWVEEFRWLIPYERSPMEEPANWSVFDPEGRWLGRVEVPAGFQMAHVGSDRVLGFVVDEFDVREIYAYRLRRDAG